MEQDEIDFLIVEILKVPGSKIITLAYGDEFFQLDIGAKGTFGHHPGHEALFRAKLVRALQEGGCMIIREFLSLRIKTKVPSGKEMWIPEKNLYGVSMSNGKWRGLGPEDVQLAHQIDAETGKPIPREEEVHFRGFPLPSNTDTTSRNESINPTCPPILA